MEAFSGVGRKLDVVRQGCEGKEGKEAGGEEGEGAHAEGGWRLVEMDDGVSGKGSAAVQSSMAMQATVMDTLLH